MNTRIVQYAYCLAFVWMGLTWFPALSWSAPTDDAWRVRRTDRRPILIRRFKEMLHRKPFSSYAFNRLMRMHTSSHQKSRLIGYYLKKSKTSRSSTYVLLLGRMYLYIQRYASALQWFTVAEQKVPSNLDIQLYKARCFLGLKKYTDALALFKKILPRIRSSYRKKKWIRRIAHIALKSKNQTSIHYIVQSIRSMQWSSREHGQLARIFIQYQHSKEGIVQLRRAIERSRGRQKVQYMLEMIRTLIRNKQYAQGQEFIQKTRKMGTLHKWISWELYMLEIQLHRANRQLAMLTARLDRAWRNTRNYRKIVQLARLYEELKVDLEAEKFYLRALKLRPASREARIQLIRMYKLQKKRERARHHIALLIRYKHASFKHYLEVIQDALKRSRHPALARWNQAWPSIYKRRCRYARRRYNYAYRYRRLYRRRYRRRRFFRSSRTRELEYKCSQKKWLAYRKKRWGLWQKQATSIERKAFTKGLYWMRLAKQRLKHSWEALRDLEQLFEHHGQFYHAKRTMRQLFATTGAELRRIQYMHYLLRKKGKTKDLQPLIRKALQTKWLSLSSALQLAEYSYHLQTFSSRPNMTHNIHEQRKWRTRVCPWIRRFLRRSFTYKRPITPGKESLLLSAGSLLWRCGERSRALQKLFVHLEHIATTHPIFIKELLKIYIRYQLKKPLSRLLKSTPIQTSAHSLETIKQILKKSRKKEHIHFVLDVLQKELHQQPKWLMELIQQFCTYKKSCLQLLPSIEKMVYNPRVPIRTMLAIMRRLNRFRILQKRHNTWLQHWVEIQYKKTPHKLQQIVEEDMLFTKGSQIAEIHRRAMLYILQTRMLAPKRVRHWGRMFRRHIQRTQYRTARQTMHELLSAAKRFPVLYRHIIAHHFTSVWSRARGQKMLRSWLQKHMLVPDLQLVEYALHKMGSKKAAEHYQSLLSSAVHNAKEIHTLEKLVAFARKQKWKKLYQQALHKWHTLRPQNIHILYRLIWGLEYGTNPNNARIYWKKWFKHRSQPNALKQLMQRTQNCCAEEHESRLLLRLTQESYDPNQKTVSSKLWASWRRTLSRLHTQEQSMFIEWISKKVRLQPKYAQQLIRWALHKKKLPSIYPLYMQLSTRAVSTQIHLAMAQALDQKHVYTKGQAAWLRYIQASRKQKRSFFLQHAQRAQKKNQIAQAHLFAYRATTGRTYTTKALHKLKAEGRTLEAWGAWIHRQKEDIKRCFTNSPKTINFTHVAQTLWKLNAPYSGPFMAFGRCQWLPSPREKARQLSALARYLKRNPKIHITLYGSADPTTEIQPSFLSQKRVHVLRTALLQRGIDSKRIRTTSHQFKRICPPRSRAECQNYRRHVFITTRHEEDRRTALRRPVAFFQYRRSDADRDGIPDYRDLCPLQYVRRSLYRRKRRTYIRRFLGGHRGVWRYRYRRRRSYRRIYGIRTTTYNPWPIFPLRAVSRRKLSSTSDGCPRRQKLWLQSIDKQYIKFTTPFHIRSRTPYSLYGINVYKIRQVAALLRMSPTLGNVEIQVHFKALPRPSSYSAHSPYKRHYYRARNTRSLQRLQNIRGRTLRSRLRRYGLPYHRTRVKMVEQKTQRHSKKRHAIQYSLWKLKSLYASNIRFKLFDAYSK